MTTTTTTTDTLTALDRCDRCPAQAYVRWDNGLQFCNHHDRKHRPALLATGARIVIDDALLSEATEGLDKIVGEQA